jgi:CHASE2 domain-containing sensor protein
MDGRGHRWLALALLCAGVLAGAAALVSHAAGALGWLERPSIDARFSVRGHRPPAGNVEIVALDTYSYRNLPLPPLPRALDARLVEHLTTSGARVIAFDFALERPSSQPAGDRALELALRRARHAVVSVTAVEADGSTAPLLGRVPFAATAVRPGVTLLPVDGDGAVRGFPSALGGVESFALAAAQSADAAVGARPPVGSLIDYPGPPGTVPSVPFLDVLSGRFDPRSVRGKVVVVGPTAPVLQDIHRSPVGAAMPGPEIQADAIATALSGYPLRRASSDVTMATLLGLGLIVALLTLLFGWVWRRRFGEGSETIQSVPPDRGGVIAIGVLSALGWSVASQLAFNGGTVLDYTDGLLSIAIATAAAWAILSLAHRRERRQLRRLFAASTPEVVERVLARGTVIHGGGAAEEIIAGFRIEQEIGRGGMGVVYRAVQLHLDRPVALKLIRQELADSAAYRARFVRESRLAAAVTHPHVIPVLDAGEDSELLYLAMQFIDGVDLSGMLEGEYLPDPGDAARLLAQVAGALDAAHERGLVHRDVKPANILLGADDLRHAFLGDFGVARELAGVSQVTSGEGWVGTPDYLAPEQIEGRHVDHRVDIYALAGVLYHCLTGSVPFPREDPLGTMWAHFNAPRPSASAVRPELPESIDRVIARGMAVAPPERFQTAGAFAAAALEALGVAPLRVMSVRRHRAHVAPVVEENASTRVSELEREPRPREGG